MFFNSENFLFKAALLSLGQNRKNAYTRDSGKEKTDIIQIRISLLELWTTCGEGDPASVGPGQGPDHLGRDQDRARAEADSGSAPSFQIHEQVIHRFVTWC